MNQALLVNTSMHFIVCVDTFIGGDIFRPYIAQPTFLVVQLNFVIFMFVVFVTSRVHVICVRACYAFVYPCLVTKWII